MLNKNEIIFFLETNHEEESACSPHHLPQGEKKLKRPEGVGQEGVGVAEGGDVVEELTLQGKSNFKMLTGMLYFFVSINVLKVVISL